MKLCLTIAITASSTTFRTLDIRCSMCAQCVLNVALESLNLCEESLDFSDRYTHTHGHR